MADAGSGLSARMFFGGAALVVIALAATIWFAIPGPDAKHRLVAPSGQVALEMGEICREALCRRVAIAETIAADGTPQRRGCAFALAATSPVLVNVEPYWSPDERSVEIIHSGTDGTGGSFVLDLPTDCTITAD